MRSVGVEPDFVEKVPPTDWKDKNNIIDNNKENTNNKIK